MQIALVENIIQPQVYAPCWTHYSFNHRVTFTQICLSQVDLLHKKDKLLCKKDVYKQPVGWERRTFGFRSYQEASLRHFRRFGNTKSIEGFHSFCLKLYYVTISDCDRTSTSTHIVCNGEAQNWRLRFICFIILKYWGVELDLSL